MMREVAHTGARLFLLLILLATCWTGKLGGAPRDYAGLPIRQILFDPPIQPIPDEQLTDLLPVKVGEELDLRALRAAIVRLYETGRYLDISVDAEPADGGVTLRFLTRTTWFVGGVRVEGVPEPPNAGQLVSATQLELGREFTEEGAQEAITRIENVLRANGFYEAVVERLLEYEAAFGQVNVLFLVNPGPRASFAAPEVQGVDEETAKRITRATNWQRFWLLPGWKQVTERRVQSGLERVRDYFQKRGYLLNSVNVDELRYEAENRTATPVLRVEQGPIVEVETTGRKVSGGRLRRLVPIFQEQSLDRDLIEEGARNLEEYFQSRGYFEVAVSFEQQQEASGRQRLEYDIQTGTRYELVKLEIEGNRYFDDATIKERINIRQSEWPRYRRGLFSQALVESDITTIRELYRSNGFRDVNVTARTEAPYQGNEGKMAVTFTIEEGQQWLVSGMELEGVSEPLRPQVESLLSSVPGQPFSEANVARDRDNVLEFYYNNGYLNASLDWEVTPEAGEPQTNVKFTVEEGERQFVRASLIGGLSQTDPDMVYDRILLQPGDPLSQSLMVESQRRLYDLGIFARVDQAIQNPDGLEESKYLLHQFEEARKYSVSFGIGAQLARIGGGVTDFENPAGSTGFSPRFTFGLSRSNMFGVAHTATFQARISDTQRRALVNYLAPQFKGEENLSLTFIGLGDFSRDINTFTSTRWEGSVQLSNLLGRDKTLQYRLTYRRVSTRDLNISPELVPIFAQSARVGLFTIGLTQDRRDNPLDSTRGQYNAVEASVATKYLGSQTDYFRLTARNSSYRPLGRGVILARSLQVGWLTNMAEDEDANPIPLPERIFSGGASSHRGFPDNQSGPRDLETGFVIGGQALLMHTTELRFPLVGDYLSGVLFHDAGNTYSKLGNISFRFNQRDKEDFDYMVQTFGFGVRYQTPIGPVRLDLSFTPNPVHFFGFKGTREDLVGGTGEAVDQRINPLQFFFSIGQTF